MQRGSKASPLPQDYELRALVARVRAAFDATTASEGSERFDGMLDVTAVRKRIGRELKSLTPAEDAKPMMVDEASFYDAFMMGLEQVSVADLKVALRSILSKHLPAKPVIVVGPVIGKVTDTTARVIMECTSSMTLTAKVKGEDGELHEKTLKVKGGKVEAVTFTGLTPKTSYTFSIDGAVMLVKKSGFTTLPPGGFSLSDKPQFAIASCNSVKSSYETSTTDVADLWNDLATTLDPEGKYWRRGRSKKGKVRKDKVDYMVHLGDNVYLDIEWHLVEKNAALPISGLCKWGMARRWVESVDWNSMTEKTWKVEQQKFEEEIEDLFRGCYRETWGYPPQRFVMANVPNLMIPDDHDVRDDWGDRPEDKNPWPPIDVGSVAPLRDPQNIDAFLGSIAWRVLNDYQVQLYEDVPYGEPVSKHYHSHIFGDVALVFLEQRACKTLHYDEKKDVDCKMLGAAQWNQLDKDFGDDGALKDCKALFILSPQPVAYICPTMTKAAAGMVDDLNGQWSAAPHMQEQARLLDLLLGWRNSESEREVLIVGGDVHEGGWTSIHTQSNSRWSWCPFFSCRSAEMKDTLFQLTTSAIAQSMTAMHQGLAVFMTRDVGAALDGYKLNDGVDGKAWSFQHAGWTNFRNYGMVKVSGTDSHKAVFTAFLRATDGYWTESRRKFTTKRNVSHPIWRCWTCLVQCYDHTLKACVWRCSRCCVRRQSFRTSTGSSGPSEKE